MIKKYIFPLTLLVSTLISCSNEESTTTNPDNENLFKSYKISRDAQGKYSIDYNVAEGAYSETSKDISNNTNGVYVFEGNATASKKAFNNLELENNKINIEVFENNQQRRSITVEDEMIVMNKNSENSAFLTEYSLENLNEDEYILDFKVKEGINVVFDYNDEENIYEVHLKEGLSTGTTFTKVYKRIAGLPLRIDFVNYIKYESQSKSLNQEVSYRLHSRPRIGDVSYVY